MCSVSLKAILSADAEFIAMTKYTGTLLESYLSNFLFVIVIVSLYTATIHFLPSSPSGSVPHAASATLSNGRNVYTIYAGLGPLAFMGSGHMVFMSG